MDRTPPSTGTSPAAMPTSGSDGRRLSSGAHARGDAADASSERRERERRVGTLLDRARALNRREADLVALSAANDDDVSTGALALAVGAALALAATPTPDGHLFVAKAARLATWVAGLPEPSRADVAILVDAALAVDARRHAPDLRGAPTLLAPSASELAAGEPGGGRRPAVTAEVRARCIEAAAPVDPDLALVVLAHAVGTIPTAPPSERGPAIDAVEEAALALCARPASPTAGRDAIRPALVASWLALRRHRPGAAAVLRARLRLDGVHAAAGWP